MHLIWGFRTYSTLGSSLRERGGALLSNPFRLYSTHFILAEPRFQASRKETESRVSALLEPVTCLLGQKQQQQEKPSMLKRQLLSPPALYHSTLASFPCPSLESLFISSTAWLGSEGDTPPHPPEMKHQRLALLAEQSSCCVGVGLSKTTN